MSMWHEKSNIVTDITGKRKKKTHKTEITTLRLSYIEYWKERGGEITFIYIHKHYQDFQIKH